MNTIDDAVSDLSSDMVAGTHVESACVDGEMLYGLTAYALPDGLAVWQYDSGCYWRHYHTLENGGQYVTHSSIRYMAGCNDSSK